MSNDRMKEFIHSARAPVAVDEARVAELERALREVRIDGTHVAGYRKSYVRWMLPLAAAAVLFVTFRAGAAYAVHRVRAAAHDAQAAASVQAVPPGDGTSVTFLLVAPDAHAVSVVGEFNDWTPERTPLVRSNGNVWSVVVRLAPGSYTYAFVIDGKTWTPDPSAPRAMDEDFGRPSSILFVGDQHETI